MLIFIRGVVVLQMVESGRSLCARSKTSYVEVDEDNVIDEVGNPELPVVTTTMSLVSAKNTNYVVSCSSACINSTTSLVSSTMVSMAVDYVLSPLASISVTDLQGKCIRHELSCRSENSTPN